MAEETPKMASWKRALIFSSMGVGVALFVSGRRAAGVALAGVGVGGLVYENRETLAKLADDMPQFLEKGTQLLTTVAVVGQRLMEARRSALA
jgi:hypothetical protein